MDLLPQVYCVCRTSQSDRFMIGCDRCNEWFHGDCIGISVADANNIQQYFCENCRAKNPSLEVVRRKKKKRIQEPPGVSEDAGEANSGPEYVPEAKRQKTCSAAENDSGLVSAPETECITAHKELAITRKLGPTLPLGGPLASGERCGKCIGCFRTEDCGKCEGCLKTAGSGKLKTCLGRRCVQQAVAPCEISEVNVKQEKQDRLPNKKSKHRKKRAPKKGTKRLSTSSQKQQSDLLLNQSQLLIDTETGEVAEGPDAEKQCLGPECVYSARLRSKYCSDACGLNLATKRLEAFMPERVAALMADGEPAATRMAMEKLELLKCEQKTLREELNDLERQEEKLTQWQSKLKGVKGIDPESEQSSDAEGNTESEQNVFCVTCGHEIGVRSCLRHMSRCFAKIESQTSYGSSVKTANNPYNVFCDAFNKTSKTFCKRLRIMCPEHFKEPKVEEEEVCGCPCSFTATSLTDVSFGKPYCRFLKKKCLKHYKWDRIWRATIDMRRLKILLRCDEILEEQKHLDVGMKRRKAVLALLLNEVTAH